MAIRDKDGNLRGKVGGEINRVINNRNIVQAAPVNINQTRETKNCSSEWGLVSTTGKVIRKAMSYICEAPDGAVINRLNAVVKSALSASEKEILRRDLHDGDLACFSGFQFNINSPTVRMLKVRPLVSVSGNFGITVTIPSFSGQQNVLYPRSQFNVRCSLCISVTAFNLRDEYYIVLARQETDIKMKQMEASEWHFDPLVPAGCFLLVCMSLHYYTEDSVAGRRYVNGKECCPAEILAAFHAGTDNTGGATAAELVKDALNGYRGNEMLRQFDCQ